jgi:polyhydroxyalkanoate synthesis regulator phasin
LCFSILVWLIVRAEPWRSRTVAFANRPTENREKQFWPLWIGIPLLFLVWANAHGSFLIGVFVLGCHVLGRMIEVVGQTRGLKAIFRDRWLVRWILLTEAAIAMSLVNPYGIDLVIETALFNSNSNMKDIVEWYPLKLVDAEGLQFCLAVTLWIALYRHSRQRVSPIDVLLLLVFSAGVAKAIRIIGWFAAVFSLCMMPHVADVGARLLDKLQQRVPAWLGQRKFAYSLVCLLFVWIAFAGSPLGGLALGGKPRPASRVYTSQTPRGIAKFLRRQPPQGLVYAPQWWADWIAWDGPAGIKTVVSTNVHLAPRLVWDGYMQVSQGREFWDDLLDRWNVDTVIADKKDQERLTRELRGSDVWQLVYEDDFGIIAKRRSRLNAAKP